VLIAGPMSLVALQETNRKRFKRMKAKRWKIFRPVLLKPAALLKTIDYHL
jgi:hypothetical protein